MNKGQFCLEHALKFFIISKYVLLWEYRFGICFYVRDSLYVRGFPGGSDGKASVCNAGDLASIPGLGRSPGEGNGSLLQYSHPENPMDREAW